MQAAFVLYPGFTALDIVGPDEVLRALPSVDAVLVAGAGLADVPAPDLVVVPGGPGSGAQSGPGPLVDRLRAVHPGTRFTTSVCTGSIVLAAAGLLDGLTATTHWAFLEELGRHGAAPVTQRVVAHPEARVVTAAGVSSGIDMALRLAALLEDDVAAQAVQVVLEYDPDPPFDAGHPSRVGPEVMARLRNFAEAAG